MSCLEERKDTLFYLREAIQKVTTYMTYPEEIMIVPIALNKRSPYEIVAHLMIWDGFVLKKRLPQILHDVQRQEVMKESAFVEKVQKYIRKNTPTEVFHQFIEVRKILLQQLEHLTEDEWYDEFLLADKKINLFTYMKEMIKHDDHHFKQIEAFLEN